ARGGGLVSAPAPARGTIAALDGAASLLAVLVGVALVAWAASLVLGPAVPERLLLQGLLADDGWSRAARAAVLLATGLATLGLVQARGLRRLAAALLLALAG